MREFLKDLFTLRTVWIDKGRGRWTVRKRFHPVMRAILFMLVISAGLIVYAKSDSLMPHKDAEAITKPELITTAKLPTPEPVPVPAPEHESTPALQPVKENSIIIPLKNVAKKSDTTPEAKPVKTTKKREIILPSEANPDADRIITTKLDKPETVAKNNNNGKYRIMISKSSYTLSLYKGDELVKQYPVAVGKNPGDKQRVGDNRTPTGDFKIVSIENASKWSHDFRDGKGKIAGAYGPWFLRLDAKGWRGIGIHGTHDPDSRGTNATEGCIRLSNEDIAELKTYAYRNMPVVIREN